MARTNEHERLSLSECVVFDEGRRARRGAGFRMCSYCVRVWREKIPEHMIWTDDLHQQVRSRRNA